MIILLSMLGLALAEQPVTTTAATTDVATDAVAEVSAGPDRSAPPPVRDPSPLPLAEPTVVQIRPGLTLHHVQVANVPKVSVNVRFGRGAFELNGALDWVAQAEGYLQDQATDEHSAEDLSLAEELINLGLWSDISYHSGSVTISVPKEELGSGVSLMREVLFTPSFPNGELKRWKRETGLWWSTLAPTNNSAVAQLAMSWTQVPAAHVYGLRPDLEALKGVKRKDLLAFHEAVLAGAPVDVIVVGDISLAEATQAVTTQLDGLGADQPRGEKVPVPPLAGMRVVAVDMPGNAQAVISLNMPAPLRDAADRVDFSVVNYALGGHFLSRLNANLREDKGYTYGTSSSFSADKLRGAWSMQVDVARENTAAAIVEIEAELSRIAAEGVTPDEVEMCWRESLADWNDTYRSAGSAARRVTNAIAAEESMGDQLARIQATKTVTTEASKATAERWFAADAPRVWVVVGDRGALVPELAKLGWEAEWVSAKDAVLGTF